MAEVADGITQAFTTLRFAGQYVECCESGSGHAGRLGGGVDVGAGELDQMLDQRLAASNEGASGTQRLAQRSHQYRDAPDVMGMTNAAVAVSADYPQAMGIVDHQPGIMPGAEVRQCADIGNVAVHAEYTVADHEFGCLGRCSGEQALKIVVVTMMKASRAGSR